MRADFADTIKDAEPASMVDRWPAKLFRATWQTLVLLALSFVCYYVISNYLLQSVRVVGSSMSPTLVDADSYLLNRWIYIFRNPKTTEIVVLRDPMDGGFSVKRVVAGPGDKVLIKDGNVFVNGAQLNESYLRRSIATFAEQKGASYQCGSAQFFVLGDNRNNSVDSRVYGPVPRKNILGMVIR